MPPSEPAFKIPESVLVVIHTAALDVLLIERADHPGFWQSVTGSKDFIDEELAVTAQREVFEETGIRICDPARPGYPSPQDLRDWGLANVYDIYPSWLPRYAPGINRNTEHVFSLQVPREIALTLSACEHTAYVWLPYHHAADQCFSSSNAEAILQLPARASQWRDRA